MSYAVGRKLELVCVLCNDSLADLEKACAGLLGNSNNKNESGRAAAEGRCGKDDSMSALSDANSTLPDVTPGYTQFEHSMNLPAHFGGYMPLSDQNHKQVVATKCGHMFHQGCLRKHIHKTLTEGKGGSLFCPICTRPFAMNRLWPVLIPPTKSQQDRYLQVHHMKTQNVEMVKQLKEIRAKVLEEEERLKKIKEDSEQCLNDIQKKQNLLDSVNGPTNKELAELAKVHAKRQEILHVVTKHNADLLKLLAEESNIGTATAGDIMEVPSNSPRGQADQNQNYLPLLGAKISEGHQQHAQYSEKQEEYHVRQTSASSRKASRKAKKEKSRKKSRSKKKSRRRHHHHHHHSSSSPSREEIDKRRDGEIKGCCAGRMPSAMIPGMNNNNLKTYRLSDKNQAMKSQCRKVDTFTKWKIDSMKELMGLPGFSEMNYVNISKPSSVSIGNDRNNNYPVIPPGHHRQQNTSHHSQQQDSVNIILSRKPNMLEKDGFGGMSKMQSN